MNKVLIGVVMIGIVGATFGENVEDSRFATPHDKDHPWGWTPQFTGRAAWEDRADFLRHQAMVAQGLWPMPPKTPLNAVIHGKIDRDTYTIEKVCFESMPGLYVTGNLYRPKGKTGKVPGVLCPYGHWPNGRFIWKSDADIKIEIDSGAETDPIAAKTPLQANLAMLARMGCIAFQYDMIGYCDSDNQIIKHREGFTDTESILRLQSFMGLQTWNSIRSMDFLLSLPDVDPERVAVTGSSSGATQAIALNAVDPRATTAFPMVMVSMNMQGGCVCENAPLYRVETNNVELATLVAPKPEGMAAAKDWTNDFLTRGLPEMRSIWALYGAEGDVEGQHFDFGHNHNLHSREAQYNFLNKQLKLGWPEPVTEKPFEPVEPKDLSVYDADHPRPKDEADAPTLRKRMTAVSDEQLAAMSDEQRAQTVWVALKAMVVDQLPKDDEVGIVQGEPIHLDGGASVWNGEISRKGLAERVPCKVISPAKWNGAVVVWASPEGCKGLSENDASVKKLLESGAAVMTVDPFGEAEFVAAKKAISAPAKKNDANPPYAAYKDGYDRSVIANRVHDLLSAIALARGLNRDGKVSLVAFGDAGISGLLTKAVVQGAIDRAAIDLNQFDFDSVTLESDPMLLPGALKYGGVNGFVPLCSSGLTMICDLKTTPKAAANVTIQAKAMDAAGMVDWVLGAK
jgi:hypothetical protein